MYSYSYDATTGGIVLNSSPTVFSKEPRPVWAAEMNLLGFHQYWDYDEQNDIPYMWAESNAYWYRGTQLAKIKGGDLYTAPELIPTRTEDNSIPFSKEDGFVLQPIDISAMSHQNEELMTIVENTTVKKIVKEYEKFKNRLDIFHVAFSGGKDSAVLLDLIKKALPIGSFVVIFGDTGMEFPDTYDMFRDQIDVFIICIQNAKNWLKGFLNRKSQLLYAKTKLTQWRASIGILITRRWSARQLSPGLLSMGI